MTYAASVVAAIDAHRGVADCTERGLWILGGLSTVEENRVTIRWESRS
jgi:hypothetical protein